jgi:hypothetical protein
MLQQIIVIVVFLAAIAYVGRLVYKSFHVKNGCASGCGKCGAIDVASIEKQMKQKGV